MKAELPFFFHLLGLALWTGGAAATLVLARAVARERDWRLRAGLLNIGRTVLLWLVWPGAIVGLGSGVGMVVTFREWPPPVWLYVKLGVVALALVGSITTTLSLAKARQSASVSMGGPSAEHEDRFDSMRRGYQSGAVILALGLAIVVALSAVKPNW